MTPLSPVAEPSVQRAKNTKYISDNSDLEVGGGEHEELLQGLVIAPHGRVVEGGQAVPGDYIMIKA